MTCSSQQDEELLRKELEQIEQKKKKLEEKLAKKRELEAKRKVCVALVCA